MITFLFVISIILICYGVLVVTYSYEFLSAFVCVASGVIILVHEMTKSPICSTLAGVSVGLVLVILAAFFGGDGL